MKAEIQFVLDRAAATNSVAAAIAADWLWPEKTVAVMESDAAALAAQADVSDTKDQAYNKALADKNSAFLTYHQTTVELLGMTKTHYRNNPAAVAALKKLSARGQSDQNILNEGSTFAKVWAELDATYLPDQVWTLTAFQAAGTATAATVGALTTADVAWSTESAKTDALADGVEDTNTAWYADATKKFGPQTPHGVTIRQEIPTTTAAVNPPAAPVVLEAQALGGGKIHIDFQPPASGYIQVYHQAPGASAFTLLQDKLTAEFYEVGGLPVGANSFKFVGVNSGGSSPDSPVLVLQVT
jgi:hypothetical protein